jgi:hypothetical protein
VTGNMVVEANGGDEVEENLGYIRSFTSSGMQNAMSFLYLRLTSPSDTEVFAGQVRRAHAIVTTTGISINVQF